MAQSVGEIGLDLVINQKQYDKQLKGITSMAKKAGATLAAAFTVKKIVDFGKDCLELGSNLAEVQNVVDVTFPNMANKVNEFAQSAATSFGLSETMAKKFTGTFGAMAKAFGFSESAAYEMGTTLTGLAGDVASFYNISQDEAYTKLKSVFTGETESLKELGIVMTQSALDTYALANGYGKTTQAMSEAEKVALRYAFVQNQLSAATGDFARTSDSWANQVRILSLQFNSLKATIGQGLINVFTPVIKAINALLGKLQTLAVAFKSFTEMLTGKKSAGVQIANTGAVASDSLSSAAGAADNLAGATTGAGKAAKKAAKEMKALMSFDSVNKLSDTSSDSDSGSGVSGGIGATSIDFGASNSNMAEMDSASNELASKMEKYFNKIREAIEPTVSALKRLWNEGFAKLGNFTWTSLQSFYKRFLVPVGKWVLGTGLPRLIDALNEGLMNVDFNKINKSLDRLWEALTPFAINIGEGLLWFWENVLVPLGTWTANEIVPRFLDTLSIAIDAFNRVIESLKPLFQWFWDNFLAPLAKWTADIFLDVWDEINSVLKCFGDWCVNTLIPILAPIFETLGSVIINAFGPIADIIGNIIDIFTGVIEFLTGKFTGDWSKAWEGVQTIFQGFSDFICSIWEGIKNFFGAIWEGIKQIFAPVIDWFRGVFDGACNSVKSAFSSVGSFFQGIWSNICNVFGNVAGWFGNTFKAAWEAVKNVFSAGGKIFDGIKDGILNGLKAVVNAIITGINKVIAIPFNGINAALKGIKNISILGLKPFDWVPTIGVPQIPKLAQGGYVKPNTPQLAMIGDNKHQGEVVAPEDKLRQMAMEASQMTGSSTLLKEAISVLKAILKVLEELDLNIQIDGMSLKKYVVNKINEHTRATGKCEIIT